MPRIKNIFVLTVLVAFGVQGFAASVDMAEPEPKPPAIRHEGWQMEMDLAYWQTATLHDDLKATVEALSAAHGMEKQDVLLNAAELYLSHMLIYEASSTLEGVTPETEPQKVRYAALTHAAQLLEGTQVDGFDASPLMAEGRPDSPFWASLQAIASADVQMLGANIKPSFSGLTYQSRAVLRAMLPVFTEAAIETRNMDHAKAALGLLTELPDLNNAPVGYFLRGRAAEVVGNEPGALDAYFEAAKGWDQYAARARLAVADMSLKNGSPGALLAAKSTLTEGAESWRGNRYELELLKRLARIHDGLGDDVQGLLARGKLIMRFSHVQEAETAKQEAADLLEAFYQKGVDGALPLGPWIDVHLQFLPFFRTLNQFPGHTEDLGDFLMTLGATDLAAREYRRAMDLLKDSNVSLSEARKARDVFRLQMKLAKSQLHAGLTAEARVTLDLISPPVGTTETQDLASLRARVLAEMGDKPAFLETSMPKPSAEYLRNLGLVLSEEGKWASSIDVFQQLWERFPKEFSVNDATHLLIAANRTDQTMAIDKVLRAFPSLTESKPLIKLAKSIDAEAPQLMPLRADTAQQRLDTLKNAFESIKDSGISP
jgi:tetratricopeptide (TPR) repeat protein